MSRKKINNYMICLDRPLGTGATGRVFQSYLITNPEQIYAAKIIQKKLSKLQNDQYKKQALKRECLIQRQLNHPNIVSLIDMHQTNNNIYIFQQICLGSSLKEVLAKRGNLQQSQVFVCMKQICLGYSELVKKGIIHRDLKPQNILISGQQLKISDFGFAKQITTQNQFLMSIVGSPIYMSPQILKGEKYNSKCDVWSFGIILFQLIYGHFPWINKNTSPTTSIVLLNKIFTEPLKFPSQPVISDSLKDLIQQCLKLDQKQRISWLQIFQHPIFEQQSQIAYIAKQYRQNAQRAKNLLNDLAQHVKTYQLVGAFLQFKVKALDFRLFSKIIRQYLIPETNESQLNIMYQMFDKDCNGVIDIQQFAKAFRVCDQKILKLFNQMVQNNLFYEDMKDEDYFKNIARTFKSYSEQVIQEAYKIIYNIQYQSS